ncbi:MAG: ABC transporter ATP-binding protein [Sphingobacteriales bacterium]
MAFLQVNDISKYEGDSRVVNNISFVQERYQKIAISGETGSGKTSLLKMIAGLMQPASGDIFFQNEKVIGPNEQLIPGHPLIAYMSQYFELRNNYWVNEILEMANKLPEQQAEKIYTVCQIEHLLKRRTNQLSGGEKQRIALARLLTTTPQLLLLDEPFSNLDALHKSVIKKVIHDIGEQLNITCIMVSHDPLDVLSWADIILVMKDGHFIQRGNPHQIYHQPVNEYCAGLFGEYNLINVTAFSSFASDGENLNSKQMLIRPEQIILTESKENSINGIIKNILFWGSYYTADVMVREQTLRVKTNNSSFKKGDLVSLSLTEDVWHI